MACVGKHATNQKSTYLFWRIVYCVQCKIMYVLVQENICFLDILRGDLASCCVQLCSDQIANNVRLEFDNDCWGCASFTDKPNRRHPV